MCSSGVINEEVDLSITIKLIGFMFNLLNILVNLTLPSMFITVSLLLSNIFIYDQLTISRKALPAFSIIDAETSILYCPLLSASSKSSSVVFFIFRQVRTLPKE